MNFETIKNIHFVGIGGIGMSGIAGVLAESGADVSGCDLKSSAATDLLAAHGVPVSIGHDPAHVENAGLVIVTAAIRGPHEEVDAARRNGIPVMKRSQVLGDIVNRRRAIAVAGTHGKTTTSSMIATVLIEAGLDPTVIVGGIVRNFGSNSRAGRGAFLVVEADEYDRTFHEIHPEIAVITNIEADHLEYYGSMGAIVEAFAVFARGVKEAGVVIGCIDDPSVRLLLRGGALGRCVAYGLSEDADLRAVDISYTEHGTSFEVPGLGFFKLFVPGEHNVKNALAAIAVAREAGLDANAIAASLARFLGVDRRFQILGDFGGAMIVDDYAHHPTEIRATLDAARRGFPNRRIVALFQPHLYSRTRDFAAEFADSLRVADVAFVSPIYAAREEPIEGITARMISDAGGVELIDRDKDGIVAELRERLQPNDLFITMGAGDVHEIAEALAEGAL